MRNQNSTVHSVSGTSIGTETYWLPPAKLSALPPLARYHRYVLGLPDASAAKLVALPASAETSLGWEVILAGSVTPLAAMAKPRLKPVALAKRRVERIQGVKCMNIIIVNSSLERQG